MKWNIVERIEDIYSIQLFKDTSASPSLKVYVDLSSYIYVVFVSRGSNFSDDDTL